jgi:1-hydroxycarotenoid 3,4-desaturase
MYIRHIMPQPISLRRERAGSARSRAPLRVVVVGAGVGGLTAAIRLAAHGVAVTLLERAARPGGKLREVEIAGARIDAGPTVFTMRWVFEELFEEAGCSFGEVVPLRRLGVLARHAWDRGARLDLHADLERTVAAIGDFAGPRDALRYRAFCDAVRQTYRTLEGPYIRAGAPGVASLVRAVGAARAGDILRARPFTSVARALDSHFADPRLRQLFARYATYCGSSPYRAPATLLLIAHVERVGVWSIDGGMGRLADGLTRLALAKGVVIRNCCDVSQVLTGRRGADGVALASGERLDADAVIVNGDLGAIASGALGAGLTRSITAPSRAQRSLSAITWAMVASTSGFELARHNVFFSSDYAAEFDDLFRRSRLPASPSVYVCAPDRCEPSDAGTRTERLFCLVNAPPTGDVETHSETAIADYARIVFARVESAGLRVASQPASTVVTTPADFERLFPGSGGALYGRATHGWRASFLRQVARTRVPRLYVAGGGAHPGPGVPMAALSGRLAASAVMEDLRP